MGSCIVSKRSFDSGLPSLFPLQDFRNPVADVMGWCGSKQEEMRLRGLLAAKETVVQKNTEAIKAFRYGFFSYV